MPNLSNRTVRPAAQRLPLPSLASPTRSTVLPFSNISGAADDEWIGTGIAETVTIGLEPFDDLSVIDRAALLDVLTHSEVTPDFDR